ncbi:MAG: glycoside hydrolase family 16 protein [Gemmatimonadales bacterium]|nr:MAG: glycoside hydrolase family 16 protein [Gemmatimonadales bacterium]
MRPSIVRCSSCFLLAFLVACGTDAVAPTDDESRPSNLALSVTLKGQEASEHGDGSGVAFLEATGTNVSQFRFRFENGDSYLNDTGELTYIFTEEGTHSHTITALFYSETNQADSISRDVTVRVGPPAPEEMTLVWADEFDYEGPVDPEKWHHQVIPISGDSWANNEVQHYTDRTDNSYVSDGTLKIVAKRETYQFEGVTKNYTSARLNSIFVFKYGRVDIRAKLPAEAGTWPAFWTLGANINEIGNYHGSAYGSVGWPACGEIDIMEQNGWDKNHLIGHLHWGDTQTGVYQSQGGTRTIANASTTFNLYSLIWTEDEIQILFNGEVFHQTANTTGMPYDNLHYVLMNIAMGGTLGGSIPGSFTQAVMEVDYIRIYQ